MHLCFLDMDGVLADFIGGAIAHHSLPLQVEDSDWYFWRKHGMTDDEFWEPLGEHFWANLQPTSDMRAIVDVVSHYFDIDHDVFLLTSPCLTAGCSVGKAKWVDKYFPHWSRRLLLTDRKELFAGRGRVLIDDHDANYVKWLKAGGDACLVPRPWNGVSEHSERAIEVLAAKLEMLKSS